MADTVREMSLSMQDQGAVSEYMDRAAGSYRKSPTTCKRRTCATWR